MRLETSLSAVRMCDFVTNRTSKKEEQIFVGNSKLGNNVKLTPSTTTEFLHWQLEVLLVALGPVVVANRLNYIENIVQ